MRDEGTANLQSVTRAIRALELIAETGSLGVTELGRALDVHKATASRLIATLAERGLLERDPVTEKYRLGFGLIRLAGAAMAVGLQLATVAIAPLAAILQVTPLSVRDWMVIAAASAVPAVVGQMLKVFHREKGHNAA